MVDSCGFQENLRKTRVLKVFGASELLERAFELLERVFELLEREFEELVRAAEELGGVTERFRRATTGSRFTAKEFSASWRGQDFDGCEVHHWVEARQLKRQRKPRQ